MKISEVSDLVELRRKLKNLRKLELGVTGYPVFRGSLVIHGAGDIDLPLDKVRLLIEEETTEITRSIESLGVEVDE